MAVAHAHIPLCPDTRARVHQWYLHISNYFEEDAKWSVASVQWTDLPFIFVASFLRSPFSSAPATPPITRSFGVVSLSSSLISTWVHTDVAESIPRFFPNCATPPCVLSSPASKELTGGVSPWQTKPIGKRSSSFFFLSPSFLWADDTDPDSFNIRLPSNICPAEYGGCCCRARNRYWLLTVDDWEVFGERQFHSIRDVWEIRKVKSRIITFFFFFSCVQKREWRVLCRFLR